MLICLLKKSLNKFVFAKKTVTNRLPTDSSGIKEIFERFTNYIKVLKIDQLVLAAVLGSLSFFAR